MKSPASATGRALLILVLVLPLIVAAISLAGTSKDLTVAWTRDAQAAQEDAAPGAGGVDPQQLAAAKQATAAAAAQAGFLDASVGAVVDGSVQLKDGTTQAASGSVQLRDGMVELQAGVGQLGAGAREISYGVTQLVDSAEQLLALQGQVLLAVEEFKTQAAAEGATPEEMAMIEQAHQALLDNTFDEEQASRLPELRRSCPGSSILPVLPSTMVSIPRQRRRSSSPAASRSWIVVPVRCRKVWTRCRKCPPSMRSGRKPHSVPCRRSPQQLRKGRRRRPWSAWPRPWRG